MALTATIIAKSNNSETGFYVLQVEFSDAKGNPVGRRDYKIDRSMTLEQFQRQVDRDREKVDAVVSFVDGLQVGQVVDPFVPAPPVEPEPPTQAELDRKAYNVLVAKLAEAKALEARLGTDVTGSLVADLESQVKAAFKSDYLNAFATASVADVGVASVKI